MRGIFGKISDTLQLRRPEPQGDGGGAAAAASAATVGRPVSPMPEERALDPRQGLAACHMTTWEWDLATDELIWGAATRALAARRQPASGKAWSALIVPGSGESRSAVIDAADSVDHGEGAPFRCRYVINNGRSLTLIEERGRWFAGADGRPLRAEGVMRASPIDGRQPQPELLTRRLEPSRDIVLRTLAAMLHDPARGLRSVSVAHCLLSPQQPGVTVSAPEVMDAAALAISRRLRRTDVVAALDPGQFAIILNGCDDSQGRQAAIAVARSIERSCEHVVAHIGLVTASGGEVGAVAMLERAQQAARIAADGSQMLAVLAPQARPRAKARQPAVAPNLISLLNGRGVSLRRRAMVELGGAGLRLEEALPIAGCAPGAGGQAGAMMGPGVLVPAAGQAGLSLLLDQRMLEQAVRLLAQDATAHIMLRVAATTLMSAEWRGAVAAWLAPNPGVGRRLSITLDESAFRPSLSGAEPAHTPSHVLAAEPDAVSGVNHDPARPQAAANAGRRATVLDPRAVAQHFAVMKALGLSVGVAGYGVGWLSIEDLSAMAVDLVCINGLFVNESLSLVGPDRFMVRALMDGVREIGAAAFAPSP